MPSGDRTGPVWGGGPGAGWGFGPCVYGLGYSRRFGRGFGPGRFWGRAWLKDEEKVELLEEEAKYLQEDLEAIKKRIAVFKSK